MPDCRNTRRLAITGQASVVSLLTEDSEDGTLLDLSRKGARLRINHLFQRGRKFTLMLNLPWEEPPVQVRLAASSGYSKTRSALNFSKSKLTTVFPSMSFSPRIPNTSQVILRETRIWRVACG
jgi:hypothetical protein